MHAVYLKNCTWTRSLKGTTPYGVLNNQKPNLSNLQPWGCKVRVHDPSGSKLDGRSKIGRWMEFDPDTKEGHCIYWPEKRSVTVERSVKFNFEDEEIRIGIIPFEEEVGDVESTKEKAELIPEIPEIPEVEDVTEQPNDEPIEVIEGRGKHVRKESGYIKRLRGGDGITGERGVLPKGLQKGSIVEVNLEEGRVGDVAIEEYAMASAIGGAEGIEPTYDEARRRPDWPK
ncbi:hypothetical protein BYT27DRAFT_7088542, partial [Phlegmacium glaucopus]